MSRGEQILRHWNLLRTLQTRGQGLPLRDLAHEFEVSERTIQRDFETLQEVGMPVEYDEDEFGRRYWRLPHDFFASGPLVVSLTEAISLHLADSLLAPLSGTHLADGLTSILNKIRSLLPDKALDYFRQLDEIVHVRRVGQTDYTRHADTVRLLVEATRNRETLDVFYHSLWRDEVYETCFDPYGVVYFEGDLYALGHSHKAGATRVLKVPRIREVQTTSRLFSRPSGFKLETHFRNTFGIVRSSGRPAEVVVRFTGPVANVVEERLWHETQQLEWHSPERTLFEQHPDEAGVLIATFRLSDFTELKRWLKGFGRHAEVLKPAELRDEMRDELLAAAGLYE